MDIIKIKTSFCEQEKPNYVFGGFDEDGKSHNGLNDRLIQIQENQTMRNIDISFKDNFVEVKKLIIKACDYIKKGGANSISNKLAVVDVSRIFSKPDSDSQAWHIDFAQRLKKKEKEGKQWCDYFHFFNESRLVPLSILHFPEGFYFIFFIFFTNLLKF